jgi:hypothetical protein
LNRLHFTSVHGAKHRQELEELLFLNPRQHIVRAAIVEGIEKYGVPKIIIEHDLLRVKIDSDLEVQTVFAVAVGLFHSQLAGVMIHTRLDPETILLLHMAVAADYSSHGRHRKQMLALRFVEQLRGIAAQIKGVRQVRVMLGHGRVRDIGVK